MISIHGLPLIFLLLAGLSACGQQPHRPISVDELTTDNLIVRAAQYAQNNQYTFNSSSLVIDQGKKKLLTKQKRFQCVSSRSEKIKGKKITLAFLEADLREALLELSILSGRSIIMDETVEGIVSVDIQGMTLKETLQTLTAQGGYSFRDLGGFILVGSSTPDSPVFTALAKTCQYYPEYVRPIDLVVSLTGYYQQFVNIQKEGRFITITAPEKILNNIQQHFHTFDRQPQQVLLELTVIEVSQQAMDILGLKFNRYTRDASTYRLRRYGTAEWEGFKAKGDNKNISIFSLGSSPMRSFVESINFLRLEGKANIRATPSIVTQNGKQANFSSLQTRWLPFLSAGGSGGRDREVSYGVEMQIKPTISSTGEVTLNILRASVSDYIEDDKGNPRIVAHSISCTVAVKDGETLVLGGLLQNKQRHSSDGIPGAKDAGWLGFLFGEKRKQVEQTEVLILIRPSILKSRT